MFPVPPVKGGTVETVIEEVSARLPGHEVHVLSIADGGLPLREQKDNRTYERVEKSPGGISIQSYIGWVQSRIRRIKPDVIWVHNRMSFIRPLREAAPHARIILSLHTVAALSDDREWTEESIRAVDAVTASSHYLADETRRLRPLSAQKVQIVPDGVSIEKFVSQWSDAARRDQLRTEYRLKGPAVFFVGRLVESKGVHVLIEAFKRAVTSMPDAVLLIAGGQADSDPGSAAYLERLKKSAERLGNCVRFLGHISHDEVSRYFIAADLLAFPSELAETSGIVVLEAMASGVPVVAFDGAGMSELIQHGVDGWLVDPRQQADGFATAIVTLSQDAAIREKFGREARRKVETRFNWDVMAKKLLSFCGTTRAEKVLIAESGTGYGGSARYLSDLVALMDQQRYSPQVLAAEEGPFIKQIRGQGIAVTVQPTWRYREGIFGILQVAVEAPIIALWLRRNKIRLVHLNNEILSHLPLLVACRLAGCRVICHLHGWRPLTPMERFAVKFVDQFVCIGEAGAAYYKQQLPGRSIEAIPNGLRLDGQTARLDLQRPRQRASMGLTSGDIAVAIIGRLAPSKGHDIYLKALAEILKQHLPVVGLIVGNDSEPGQPYLAKLRALTQELRIERRVRFVAWQEDVWPVYAAADLVVHASVEPEPFGLVILEAMAAKRPVVATAAGGVKDVVLNEETGLLIEPGDVRGMAKAIKKLITSPGFSSNLVNRANTRVRNDFAMDQNVAQMMAVYERLIQKQG